MTLFDVLSRQRRVVYLALGLLTAAGAWFALHLPSAIYPELQFQRIQVVAEGSSLGARQMVFSVTRPVEEAISIVPGVERVTSRTIRGAAELSIYFDAHTDMGYALQLVRARVSQIQNDLPAGLDDRLPVLVDDHAQRAQVGVAQRRAPRPQRQRAVGRVVRDRVDQLDPPVVDPAVDHLDGDVIPNEFGGAQARRDH